MKRCVMLVEGQTEERFVKDVLAPYFIIRGLSIVPTILTTKVVMNGPNYKGGVTSYAKLRADLAKLLPDRSALITTLLDYYGLPDDVPGMTNRPARASALERVLHVEQAMARDLGTPAHFLPFLALHEFEAWLFVNPEETAAVITAREKTPELLAIAAGCAPEEINEHPETAPSKRLLQVFPSFRKTLHGPTAVKRIGLQAIRDACPHFHQWLTKLEEFTATGSC